MFRIRHLVAQLITMFLQLPLRLRPSWMKNWTSPFGQYDLHLLDLQNPVCDDAPDLSTKEHVSALLRFLHLIIGEPSGGLAGTPTNLVC